MARLETNQGPVVLKWFGWRHPIHFYLSPLRTSRAWRSWKTATTLENAGARTPHPLFIFSRRHRGFIRENYFITIAIHPHQKLRTFLKTDTPADVMASAVGDLAVSIARMHEGGIIHRDLTSGNFLVDEGGRVYLVDLNRAQPIKHISTRQRLTDLARISFTSRDQDLTTLLARKFFQVYSVETDQTIDWERRYWTYRHRRLRRRRWKQRLRQLFHRK
ncbi:MAG: phosphotransferase [Fidelibacterota bacterium]|nr:MAG: phosphotransferase [Candidatus Neomarinimicrobiota bacterium]